MVGGRAPGQSCEIEESRVSPNLSVWRRRGDFQCAPFLFAWGGRSSNLTLKDTKNLPDKVSQPKRNTASKLEKSARAKSLDIARLLFRSKIENAQHSTDVSIEEDDDDDSVFDVSSTALFDRSRRMSDPARYIDPMEMPYLTLSTRRTFRSTGIRLGDYATILNPRTGRYRHAIIGDSREIPGVESSSCLRSSLGITEQHETYYLIYPASGLGQGTIPSLAGIQVRGEMLFSQKNSPVQRSWSELLTTILAADSRFTVARPV